MCVYSVDACTGGTGCGCGELFRTLQRGDTNKKLRHVYEHDRKRAITLSIHFDVSQKWALYESQTVARTRTRKRKNASLGAEALAMNVDYASWNLK